MDARAAWRTGQRGWPAHFPFAQFPNAPLLVALAAMVVRALAGGTASDAADAVARIALAVWAYEELARGANWFRRLLGAVVLVVVLVGLTRDL